MIKWRQSKTHIQAPAAFALDCLLFPAFFTFRCPGTRWYLQFGQGVFHIAEIQS